MSIIKALASEQALRVLAPSASPHSLKNHCTCKLEEAPAQGTSTSDMTSDGPGSVLIRTTEGAIVEQVEAEDIFAEQAEQGEETEVGFHAMAQLTKVMFERDEESMAGPQGDDEEVATDGGEEDAVEKLLVETNLMSVD